MSEKSKKMMAALDASLPEETRMEIKRKEKARELKKVHEEIELRLEQIEKYDGGDIILDMEDDVEFARAHLKTILSKGNESLDRLMDLAEGLECPRGYEVLANMLKTLSTINHDLIDLQKKRKDIRKNEKSTRENPSSNSGGSGGVNVFFGSTADMQREMKKAESIDA